MNLLNRIVVHNDWECAERDAINDNTIRNKNDARYIQQCAEQFYRNVEMSADLFRQAEQEAAQAEAEAARIAAEKEAAAAAVDVWYTEYDAALQAAGVNAGGAESAGAGGFVWPMPGYDYITCDYGDDGHRGIDIAGSEIYGQPIVAAARGEVVYSDWMDSYGYCVFIDHGNGCSTRYAHASALACSVGDVVSPGQTIAYVGSTGNSTGPHLHFEVLRAGSTTDPFDYY